MTTDELTALRERHTSQTIPPCPVCGAEMSIDDSINSKTWIRYRCAANKTHFEADKRKDYYRDYHVLRLLDERETLLAACKAALRFIAPHVEDEECEGREGSALALNDKLAAAITKAEQPAP